VSRDFPFDLLEDPKELARFRGWSEEVYRDLIAVQRQTMSLAAFDEKHLVQRAILVLDLTGFTVNTMHGGAVRSFLRILEAQQVCLPVLREFGANFVRTFADDMVALFDHPEPALDAALEIHRRTDVWESPHADAPDRADCCIGIGFGPVYAIGPNLSMGDEMNRASKLGEDTARGGETLVTEAAKKALGEPAGLSFHPQSSDDLLFGYYSVLPA